MVAELPAPVRRLERVYEDLAAMERPTATDARKVLLNHLSGIDLEEPMTWDISCSTAPPGRAEGENNRDDDEPGAGRAFFAPDADSLLVIEVGVMEEEADDDFAWHVEIGFEAGDDDDWSEDVEIDDGPFEEIEVALEEAWATCGGRPLCFVSWGPYDPF